MKKRKFKYWFTLEEHGLKGGLGSEVNNWIINSKELDKIRIKNICTLMNLFMGWEINPLSEIYLN